MNHIIHGGVVHAKGGIYPYVLCLLFQWEKKKFKLLHSLSSIIAWNSMELIKRKLHDIGLDSWLGLANIKFWIKFDWTFHNISHEIFLAL